MTQNVELELVMKELRLSETSQNIGKLIQEAESKKATYTSFLLSVMKYEQARRNEKARIRRLKWATLPYQRTLDEFDLDFQTGLSEKQLKELRTLNWIDQSYNLILLGPTGVGKTFLSVGMCVEAIDQGYSAYFVTMGDLIKYLKTELISRTSNLIVKRLYKADLIVLDDMMFIALDTKEANLFFHFINKIYDQTSFIVTSNKNPKQWSEVIGDEVITGAILDRLVQKAQVIELSGDSYRLTHRETIFKD